MNDKTENFEGFDNHYMNMNLLNIKSVDRCTHLCHLKISQNGTEVHSNVKTTKQTVKPYSRGPLPEVVV